MIKRLFIDTFHNSENESLSYLKENHSKINLKVIITCTLVALCLTIIRYFGDFRFTASFLENIGFSSISLRFNDIMRDELDANFYQLIYWVSVIIIFYIIPPVLLIHFVFKEKLSEYGLKLGGAFKDYKLYLIMLLVMIPLVIYFSKTESFQSRYPFYNLKEGEKFYPNFIVWEIFYFFQFFALEFFFRGFMLHGIKKRFGFYSVFIMTIPYCMIHFGKPMPETIAAIVAGVVLGVLSLKSKSIWLGVAIHCSVAITMDVCALYQKGLL